VLTGGKGPIGESVKVNAIAGVDQRPWIGVEQGGSGTTHEERGGIWLESGLLNSRRNYIEAYMCDAAVALRGREGTLSEVTCSLSLGRPVALVGKWRAQVDLDAADRIRVLDKMVEDTRAAFGDPAETGGINPLLAKSVLREGLNRPLHYSYFELSAVDAVIKWIESVVPDSARLAGEFPPLASVGTLERDNEEWIARHSV
jgi:hypothetical protein